MRSRTEPGTLCFSLGRSIVGNRRRTVGVVWLDEMMASARQPLIRIRWKPCNTSITPSTESYVTKLKENRKVAITINALATFATFATFATWLPRYLHHLLSFICHRPPETKSHYTLLHTTHFYYKHHSSARATKSATSSAIPT